MRYRWAALLAYVLALGTLVTGSAEGQGTPPPRERNPGFELQQNYPNPFNPSTTIPFRIACVDGGRQHRVTLRIYNLLAQLVAIPILQGDPRPGEAVQNLVLPCGEYTAFWNGNYLNTSQEVASGVYLYRLEVDGKATVKKMLVMK